MAKIDWEKDTRKKRMNLPPSRDKIIWYYVKTKWSKTCCVCFDTIPVGVEAKWNCNTKEMCHHECPTPK